MPLSVKSQRSQVENFLAANSLRLETVDYYAGVFENEGCEMLAGGGVQGNVLKCIAVSDKLRDTGMSLKLISHLLSTAQASGFNELKVFTKPENQKIFENESFHLIAQAPQAILMENSNGLKRYCKELAKLRKEGTSGIIVMNCNPFTCGHRYLIEQAAKQVDNLYVIAVKEDLSEFSYAERLAMLREGCADMSNVTVCQGSSYAVSATTFPTYFLKKVEDATDTQIALDLSIFAEHIAPALGATKRYVGSEQNDAITRRYNELMQEKLPHHGIEVIEVPRLEIDNEIVSASALRKAIKDGTLHKAIKIGYKTSTPYIIAHFAQMALRAELDATPKPGLVDKQDNGAHRDMNYLLMRKSIDTLLSHFTQLAKEGFQEVLPSVETLQSIGLEAEKDMLATTAGVNTHKGALFSLGIAVTAAAHQAFKHELSAQSLQDTIKEIAKQFPAPKGTHGAQVIKGHNIDGAVACASKGFPLLFGKWLPFYAKHAGNDQFALQKTLLLIMSELDDTNIYYRKGANEAAKVKQEAAELLAHCDESALQKMNCDYIKRNISPGGAADMLSLTVFIFSMLN